MAQACMAVQVLSNLLPMAGSCMLAALEFFWVQFWPRWIWPSDDIRSLDDMDIDDIAKQAQSFKQALNLGEMDAGGRAVCGTR